MLPVNLVVDQEVHGFRGTVRLPNCCINSYRPDLATITKIELINRVSPCGVLQVLHHWIFLAQRRPFAWMGHQADAGDDGIQFVVALKATASPTQYSDTVVRPNLIEWQIDFVFDRKLIQSEAKVTKHFIDSPPRR